MNQEKEIQKELEGLKTDLEKSFNEKIEQLKQKGFSNPETQKEVEQITSQLQEIEEKHKKYAEKADQIQEHNDELDIKLKKFQTQHQNNKSITLKRAFKEWTQDDKTVEQLKKLKAGEITRAQFKADLTSSSAYTNEVVPPDRDETIHRDPVQDTLRIRSLLPVATTTSNLIKFNQRSSYTDNTGYTAEGSAHSQSEFGITNVERSVQKLGARLDFSKEMLDDTPLLRTFVIQELVDRAIVKENTELLSGSGTSSTIYGIDQEATDYSDALADSNVDKVQVIIDTMRQVEDNKYVATGSLIDTASYYDILTLKDTNARYQWGGLMMDSGQLRLFGVPVFRSTAVASDIFYVGNWQRYGRIIDRMGMEVEFSDQNQDNFEKDMITAKISWRLALAATNPSAIIRGDFGVALAEGSA